VNADVARVIALEMATFPPPQGMNIQQMQEARLGPKVRPLIDDLVGDIGSSLWVIMTTIGIVLLIACANVANLVLARTEGRTQELAVRAAIGAGPGRLAGEMLVESLLLGLASGVVSVALAVGAVKLVQSMEALRLPRGSTIAVDGTSLAFALALSIAVSLIVGAVPIVKRGRVQLVDALRADNRNASAGRDRSLTRNLLTMTQVALALVLLVGSGLMIRTFQAMRRVTPGFTEPASLQTLRLAFTGEAARDDARRLQLQHDLADRLGAIPGVEAVGLTSALPMTGSKSQDPIFASDHTYAPNAIPTLRRFITAAPGTFTAFGTPVVAGREYTWTDIHAKRQVVVVSEGLAREMWGSAQAAVGKQIRTNPNDAWSDIIGVVGDIRQDGPDRPAPATVYWPLRTASSMTFLLRSRRAGSESLASDIRHAVSAAGMGIPVTQLRTMGEIYERSLARTGFTLTLLAISGGMALLLAIVGIYAVISYMVSQRTREIGIRLALGARQGGVQLMFVRHGMFWGALGVLAGLLAAVPLSRLMASLLVDVSPVDPLTYGIMGVALLAAAGAASYFPARRVTRIDPVIALRSQ
jgi:predicted permease